MRGEFYLFRRFVRDTHLYLGLIFSLSILMLAITGIYLNHKHDWFNKQNIHYTDSNYDSIIKQAMNGAEKGEKKVPEAVEIAEKSSDLFTISDINSVNYAFHGLGYFYYVHLNDELETIVVVTEEGVVAKAYSDPFITKWMNKLHVGIIDGFNFVFINDIATISIIILTITGIILSIRILQSRIKKRKRRTALTRL